MPKMNKSMENVSGHATVTTSRHVSGTKGSSRVPCQLTSPRPAFQEAASSNYNPNGLLGSSMSAAGEMTDYAPKGVASTARMQTWVEDLRNASEVPGAPTQLWEEEYYSTEEED
eukprot:1730981-Prorocentrum_lima.AAC.1